VLDLAAGASPVFLLLDGGSALGQVSAGRLGLLGEGGSAFLVGTLAGAGGEGAAPLVVLSAGGPGYLFNGCLMGATLCAGAQPGPGPLPPDPAPSPPPQPPALRASLPDDPAQRRPQAAAPWSPWSPPWPLPPLVAVEEDR
jgi:hypothetical protein